ncbi:MAG: hypothetical protein AAF620_18210 [Bacteroidota bacterium]
MTKNEMPNIPSLMYAQYEIANNYLNKGFWVKGIIFILNLIVIFTPSLTGDNASIWGVFIVSVFAILLDNNYQDKFRYAYDVGERIRKLDLIRKVFPSANNKAEEAYLISQIDPTVVEHAKKNPKNDSEYYSDREEKFEILSEHIQENSFWTSSLMELHSRTVKSIMIGMFVLIFVSIIGGMYVLSEFKEDEVTLSLNVSQYLALLVNTVFAFNILTYHNSFAKKSKQLKEIDTKLEAIKNKPELDELFISFAEYNCILYDAFPTPSSLYNKHGDRLNAVWKRRVDSD